VTSHHDTLRVVDYATPTSYTNQAHRRATGMQVTSLSRSSLGHGGSLGFRYDTAPCSPSETLMRQFDSYDEVAALAGVSRRTVERWAQDGIGNISADRVACKVFNSPKYLSDTTDGDGRVQMTCLCGEESVWIAAKDVGVATHYCKKCDPYPTTPEED
jgi:hypothetical protein